VVDLQSAHMDDVVSEIVVESSHQDIHRKPRAILEVRRVLVEHLNQLRTTYPDIGQPNLVALVIDDAAHPPDERAASSPPPVPASLISAPTAAGPTRLPPTTSSRPPGQSTRAKAASMRRDLEGLFAPR
jgi:hypothetical protein